MTSPLDKVWSEVTKPFVPLLSEDHAEPFHCATHNADSPPALLNEPPTMTPPPGRAVIELTVPGQPEFVTPAPSGNQLAPSQRATSFAATPSIVTKMPPA